MVFQQNLLEKAHFIAKMSGPTMVRPASSDFWKAPGVYKWPRRHVARLQRRLDESQIISVMRDRAQISRVRRRLGIAGTSA